jgi:cellulose synthase/poly-beta-1,6-N-acetylglucosamine synthase-like glycosyltransferase
MEVAFWIVLGLIIYTYFGYTLVLLLLNMITLRLWEKTEGRFRNDDLPDVTLLIAAYNEAGLISEKMANTMKIDYPPDRMHIIWVTDGSDDGSPALIKKFHGVQVLHVAKRSGKTAALNRAMPYINTPFTVFCDANTMLDPQAVKKLIAGFTGENIGCVAGEKRIRKKPSDSAAASGEGAYWRYESLIKILESKFYSALAAAGELYAIRTRLFEPVDEDVIVDDFLISLHIALKGYRIRYAPDAYAMETASYDVDEELKRKIRIASGGFQALSKIPSLLNIISHGFLSFEFISHKLFRWAIVPFALPLVFVLNAWLAYLNHWDSFLYNLILTLQTAFYCFVLAGFFFENRSTRFKQLFLPYYLVVMNYAQIAGLIRFLRKEQSAAWEKARRSQT